MSRIHVKFDSTNGVFEIEADANDFEIAVKQVRELIPHFSHVNLKPSEQTIETNEQDAAGASMEGAESSNERPKAPKKRRGPSTKNLTIIDDLLTEPQRQTLKDFFAEKNPKSQPDTLAVICVKLIELLERDRLSQDEIYTGIQVLDLPTPANISASLNNMVTRNKFGATEDGLFVPNFKCKDHVKLKLPKTEKSDD